MIRGTIVLVAVAHIVGEALAAQTPEQRAEIERFREEIGSVTEADRLLDRERALIERARARRDDALLHVQLGFLAHRIGELTEEQQHFEDAASEFEWASELEPQWPYSWYGLGLAELAVGEHDILFVESLRQMLGKDALSKAADAFARAARLDPTFIEAVVDLANTTLEQRRESRLRVALDALREAAAAGGSRSAALRLARGRVERTLGEGDSSAAVFQRLLDEGGGDSGVVLLELARTQFYVNRPRDGAPTYFRAAAAARSAEAVALLRSDLSWIASERELAEFDRLGPDERESWLERFWARRDALNVRRPGERLAEHYRRYFHAQRHYPLLTRHRRYDVTNPYRTAQLEFDDRGVVYLRHGEPDRRAVYHAPNVEPNESWVYRRAEGDLMFHFAARDDVSDYKLTESLLNVFGLDTALSIQTRGLGADAGFAVGLLESRQVLHSVYSRMLAGGTTQQLNAMSEERRLGDRAIQVGTTSDSYRLRFARDLESMALPLVVGDRLGAPQLLLVFAVPGPSLTPRPYDGGYVYPLDVRVAVSDRERGTPVAFVDTARVFAASGVLGRREHLTGLLELPLPPGTFSVGVAMSQPGFDAGHVMLFDSLFVPPFDSGRFLVSDVIVGRDGSGLTWVTAADTVTVNPLGLYPAGATLSLYYEVYGLARGTPYRARVEIGRGRGGRPAVALVFDQVSEGPITRVFQSIDLSALRTGAYRLALTIEGPAGDPHHTRYAQIEVSR